jgi:hypothetical protein
MAALHVWHRLDRPAQESIGDLAQVEQITDFSDGRYVVGIAFAWRHVGIAPVGPRGWNE